MISTVSRQLHDQKGAALLIVLVMVVIVGLSAGIAGRSWKTFVQRAHEAELLWRGDQYRRAIQSYYEYDFGTGRKVLGQYPTQLEDILKDSRSLTPRKHIRRLYLDPITGGEWELIKDQGGRITGVRSSSDLEPFQQDGFLPEYENFVGAASYAAWEFIYKPKTIPAAVKVPPVTGNPDSGAKP